MKKVFLMASSMMLGVVLLSSCGGSSMESDVQKMIDLGCKTQELTKKVMGGDESASAEMEKVSKELETLATSLEKKYTDKSDLEKMGKMIMEGMAKCE